VCLCVCVCVCVCVFVCKHLSKCPFQVRYISLSFTKLCMYVMLLAATQAELIEVPQLVLAV
jgi:hypothetical protein